MVELGGQDTGPEIAGGIEVSLGSRIASTLKRATGGREMWAIADQALVSGANFLTNVIVARLLGLTEFGIFALAWTAVLFFSSMQMATISAPMMSLAPKTDPEERPQYYGAVVAQEVIFTAICAVIMLVGLRLVAIFSHQPALEKLAFPLTLAMVAYLLQDFVRRYLFTTKQPLRAFINDAVSCLPQVPVIWFLAKAHYIGTPGVLWFVALTSLVGVGLGIYWLEPVVFTKKSFQSVTARHWGISRWLSPSALLWWTSNNFFALVAPAYYGAMAAGVLRASQNMVAVAHIWFLGLDNVVPAETARVLHKNGIAAASHYLRKMAVRWGLITAAFVTTLSVAPNFWLHLVYGPKYAAYGYLLRLFGLSYVLTFTGRILGAGLQALEYTAPVFWSYLIMTTFSLAIAVPLTKHMGLRGVMIGTITTQTLSQIFLLVVLIKRIRLVGVQQNASASYSPATT